MPGKRRMIRMTFGQLLASPVLYLCILSVFALCLFCARETIFDITNPRMDMAYVLDMLMDLSTFQRLLILLAALPSAAGFCNDWCCQYIRPVVVRSGVKRYAFAKVLTCFLSSLLVILAGMILFFFVMGFYLPAAHPNPINEPVPPYGVFLEGTAPVLYLACICSLFALSAALWTVIGLAVSARLPNKFVAVCTPLIAGYLLTELTLLLPPPLNLFFLSRGRNILHQGAAVSYLYTAGVFLALIAAAGFLFYWTVKRRVQNELV